jgi:hypothetical protein
LLVVGVQVEEGVNAGAVAQEACEKITLGMYRNKIAVIKIRI